LPTGTFRRIEPTQALQQQGFALPMRGMTASSMMHRLAIGSGLFTGVLLKPFNATALFSAIDRGVSA
jgi:CheY-like chemotaxis protein